MGLVTHYTSSGLGGMRTCGDLVGRVQLRNKCKISESKKYVMDKLGLGYDDIADECFMRNYREEHGLGVITTIGGAPTGSRPSSTSRRPSTWKSPAASTSGTWHVSTAETA